MIRLSSLVRLASFALSAVAWNVFLPSASQGAPSLLNFHNDRASTGQNLAETKLTPSSVKYADFGKIYAAAVDGQIYTQPLYVPDLAITGGSDAGSAHDTVFVCTQHDTVYALDAASGDVLWSKSLLGAAETTVPNGDSNTKDINPEIGITGTPVIDATADATTQKRYLYVVAKSKRVISGQSHYYLRLHVLDIASGASRSGSPALIAETTVNDPTSTSPVYTYNSGPTVPGTGSGQTNGVVGFNALREHQRPALTLVNGRLYIAFASHGDSGPYHGWVLGYNPTTLALIAAVNLTPNGINGGIWMSGGIIASDPNGALYVITGNGRFANSNESVDPVPADFDANGFPLNHNYGDSLVKLVVDTASTATNPNPNGWGLKVADYFTPYNQQTLNLGDTDYGSGGVQVLPDSVGSAAHPHLLVSSGKEGRIYLVDRDNMGKFRGGITGTGATAAFVSTGDGAVQTSQPNTIKGSLDTPAYFNGSIYYAGAYYNDSAKEFSINNGVLNFTPASVSPDTFGYLGSTPTVSASSATTNGIAWMIDRGGNRLRAYDATDLSNELYTSSQAPNSRDLLGTASKFTPPTVVDGRVFVATSEPAGPSALVCYSLFTATTTPPAQPRNLYAQTVSGGEIDLFWDDFANNETGYQIFVSTNPASFPATPRATRGADATSAVIKGLQVNTTYYFEVRATNAIGNSAFSNISATTSDVAPPVDFTNGFANAGNMLTANGYLAGSSAVVGSVLRITDNNAPGYEAHSAWLNTMQDIRTFTTEFTFYDTNAQADGFTFTVQSQGLTALGGPGGNLGYQGIGNSVAVKFDIYPNNTTGLYYNGAAPDDGTAATATSSGSIDTSSAGISFTGGQLFRATLTYNGKTLTETITNLTSRLSFTKAYTVDIPSVIGSNKAYIGFTGGTGGLTAQQDIASWNFSTAEPTTPAAPTNLVATAASGTQINLSWSDNATNETSYRIERALGSTGAFDVIGSVGANTTKYVDSGLTSSTTYRYLVTAYDDGLSSTASNIATLTTPVPPTTPSGAAPTLVTANEVDFTWKDNSNNETGFRILRSANEAEFQTIATLPANTTSYKDTTVTSATDYGYHIQAYNAAGYVDFTGFNTTTPSAVNLVAGVTSTQEGSSTPATFTVRRPVTSEAAITVNYAIATGTGQAAYGKRYTLNPAATNATSGSVVIPANTNAATILVNAIDDKAITGSQKVTLSLKPGTGYTAVGASTAAVTILDTAINEWKVKYFGVSGANSAEGADGADSDGDGLSNLMEYALGSNPLTNSSSRAPVVAVETLEGARYLTLTYFAPSPLLPDVSYQPQFAASTTSGWQAATLVGGYPIAHGDYQTFKYRAPSPIESGMSAGYMRLYISRK